MRYNKTEPKTDRHCRYSLTPVSLRGEEEEEGILDVFSRRFISQKELSGEVDRKGNMLRVG